MEYQPEPVNAVAQTGRFRTVVEDMAEMAAAAAAVHLGAQHAVGAVLGLADIAFDRLIEARPAGAALEFRLRGEQRQVAPGAGKGALAMLLEQRARARPLGALLAQDLVLLRRQLRAPFRIGLFDLEFGSAAWAGEARSQRKAARPSRLATDASRIRRSIMMVSVKGIPSGSLSDTGLSRQSYTDWEGNFSLSCEAPCSCGRRPLPPRHRLRRLRGPAGRPGRRCCGRVPALRLASASRASRTRSRPRARSR